MPALAPPPDATPLAPGEPLYAAPTTLDRIGRVMVPVNVEGQGPFRFIVDTGATRSALSPQLVARLGLPTDRSPPVRMQGVTGEAIVPTVRIRRLQAGSLLLQDQELPVVEPRVFAQADGILGVEGMAGNRLDIDFVADRVTVSRSRAQRAEPGFLVVPFYMRRGGLLLVDARIGRVPGRAIIDTGAERTLGNLELQRRLAALPGGDAAAGRPTQVYGATAEVQTGESRLAPVIRIGEASLDNLEITFADLHVFRYWKLEKMPALMIGMDLLGVVARLIVDYRRAEIHIGYRR